MYASVYKERIILTSNLLSLYSEEVLEKIYCFLK